MRERGRNYVCAKKDIEKDERSYGKEREREWVLMDSECLLGGKPSVFEDRERCLEERETGKVC